MKSIPWISDTFHLAHQVAYCSNHFTSSSLFPFRWILGLNYGRLSCVEIPHDVPFHDNALHKRCSPTMFLPSWDMLHETRHPPRVAMHPPLPPASRLDCCFFWAQRGVDYICTVQRRAFQLTQGINAEGWEKTGLLREAEKLRDDSSCRLLHFLCSLLLLSVEFPGKILRSFPSKNQP